MTSSRILFPQFRDEQSANKYPFADRVTLTANTGLKIDADIFVDASFFGVGLRSGVYLSSINVTVQQITITIGDSTGPNKLTGSYATTNPPENGVINFVDIHGRAAGILLAEKIVYDEEDNITRESPLYRLAAWPAGTHTFTVDATEFVATVVIPANEPGVRALTPDPEQLLTGDIWLVGKNGVVLRAEDANTIRVDIIGVPLFKRLVCAPQTEFPTKRFLKTINNCGPDEYGNFVITATDKSVAHPTIRIYPNNNSLIFDIVGPQVS